MPRSIRTATRLLVLLLPLAMVLVAAPGRAGAHSIGTMHADLWPSDGSAPNDPFYPQQLNLPAIHMPAAWAMTTGDPNLVVAVLDTGIDPTSPEFTGRLVPGYDALTKTATPAGDWTAVIDRGEGHGTHVTGILAAATGNVFGVAGIAPSVRIMPVRVLDGTSGEGTYEQLVDGLAWAVAHGATVVNMSLGGDIDPEDVAYAQEPFTKATEAGVVLVAAAGNDGTTATQYPCGFSGVICVGSTSIDGTRASDFSNRSSAVALAAPGEGIVSIMTGGRMGVRSGTSAASPHVAGVAALVPSIAPLSTPVQVRADLVGTAHPLTPVVPDPASGAGLLDAAAALIQAQAAIATPAPVAPTPTPSATPSASPSPSPSPSGSPDASAPASPDPDASATPSSAPGSPDPGGSAAPSASPTPPPAGPPVMKLAVPRSGATGISVRQRLLVRFDRPVAGVSTTTAYVRDLVTGRKVPSSLHYDAHTYTLTLKPIAALVRHHRYAIVLAGLRGRDGSVMARHTWGVTTGT